jgi:hypothetical protein
VRRTSIGGIAEIEPVELDEQEVFAELTTDGVDPSNWVIEPATASSLAEMATRRYEPPYDFYNDDGKPVRNPERFFAVRDEDDRLVRSLYFEGERQGSSTDSGCGPT